MSRLLTLLLLYKSGYIVGKYISIEKLVENTKKTVAEKTGFNLECEILFVDGGIVR